MQTGKSFFLVLGLHLLFGVSLLLALRLEFPQNPSGQYADWQFLVKNYAHVVVFASVFCLLALSAIVTAARHIADTSYRSMLLPIVGFAIFLGVGYAAVDLSGDNMLLLEFSKSGQVESNRCAAVKAKLEGKTNQDVLSASQIQKIFSRESVQRREFLSYSRWLYGLALMYTVTLTALTFLLLLLLCRMNSTERRSSLFWCVFISTVALLCWFPFRAQFNQNVKSKVFGDDSIGQLSFLPHGMGILELAGILLFVIMTGIAAWKFSAQMAGLKKLCVRMSGLIPVALFGPHLLQGLAAGDWLVSIPSSIQAIGVWSLVSLLVAAAIPITLGAPEPSASVEHSKNRNPFSTGEPGAAPYGGPAMQPDDSDITQGRHR